MIATLKSKMSSSQRLILVPQSFGSLTGIEHAQLANQYVGLAMSEPRTIAVLAFSGDKRWLTVDVIINSIRCLNYVEVQCPESRYNALAAARQVYEKFLEKVVRQSPGIVQVATGKPVSLLSPSTAAYATAPAALTDGSDQSMAYPGHSTFTYSVNLQGYYRITDFKIVFGAFGLADSYRYVTDWKIDGVRQDGSKFELIRGLGSGSALSMSHILGAVPSTTVVGGMIDAPSDGSERVKALELTAISDSNWIGAFELRASGYAVAPTNVAQGKTVTSLLPAYPPYTYPAANLVDANANSFAYPNSTELAYEIDLGSTMDINRIKVRFGGWGYASPYKYVTDYRIEVVSPGVSPTLTVAHSGGVPGTDIVDVPVAVRGQMVRVYASSTGAGANWIGLYEVEVY